MRPNKEAQHSARLRPRTRPAPHARQPQGACLADATAPAPHAASAVETPPAHRAHQLLDGPLS
eukprot:scaffold23434_cov135-Isochrysis_galbana.AAC.9